MIFWTIEANPDLSKAALKAEVGDVASRFKPKEMLIGYEISEDGYKHLHLLTMWKDKTRWRTLQKELQKRLWYAKPNGKGISVRAFHPRPGTEKRADMLSYMTEKKYKMSEGDNELLICEKEEPKCDCDSRFGFLAVDAKLETVRRYGAKWDKWVCSGCGRDKVGALA